MQTELVKETADARVERVKREKCIFTGPLVGITAGAAESPLEVWMGTLPFPLLVHGKGAIHTPDAHPT